MPTSMHHLHHIPIRAQATHEPKAQNPSRAWRPAQQLAAWLLGLTLAISAHAATAAATGGTGRDQQTGQSSASANKTKPATAGLQHQHKPGKTARTTQQSTKQSTKQSARQGKVKAKNTAKGKKKGSAQTASQTTALVSSATATSAATGPLPDAQTAQQGARYAGSAAAEALADRLAAQHGLPPAWVRAQVAQAQHSPSVVRLMTPAAAGTRKNWAAYRARFIEPVRLRAGQRFWQAHSTTLSRAEASYGVPASLIVGVIGVETLYGQHTGGFRVLDALSTLALDFPAAHPRAAARSAFFQDELGQFLALAQQLGRDPADWRGSYAGAMGWPQFMPSSWRRFAVDFDGDGQIDLINSVPDVIGSVANYFVAHGWKSGMPTHYPLDLQQAREQVKTLLEPDILPTFAASDLLLSGLKLTPEAQSHKGKLALVELENGTQPPSYVVGTENFYVVTRYNWSSYYALAVIELGEAVQALMPSR